VQLFACEQLHWTSGSDLHLTAGQTYSSVAANAATLFTREGGIKAIAGNGDVSLQANTGELEILADKEVVVLSVNDGIEIKANKKIVLHAGQSSIVLEGGNITFACPGNFTVKSALHAFDAGRNTAAQIGPLPGSTVKRLGATVSAASQGSSPTNLPQDENHEYTQTFDVSNLLENSEKKGALDGKPYRIYLPDGTIRQQGTLSEGVTAIVKTPVPMIVRCEIGHGSWVIEEDGFDRMTEAYESNESDEIEEDFASQSSSDRLTGEKA
jgi:type VI secretion system secreted protein VgrG